MVVCAVWPLSRSIALRQLRVQQSFPHAVRVAEEPRKKKRKRLRIDPGAVSGRRVVFNEEGETRDPLALLAAPSPDRSITFNMCLLWISAAGCCSCQLSMGDDISAGAWQPCQWCCQHSIERACTALQARVFEL